MTGARLLSLAFILVAAAGASARAASPPGLTVHVPLDGGVTDTRGLGAVRADEVGTPSYIAGPDGEAALPERGRRHVAMLRVSRLSRLLLHGRTPAAGTIMLWVGRPAAAGADTAPLLVLSSDPPLNLDVAIGGTPARLTASFDDDAGMRHEIAASIAGADPWVHVALGWEAQRGRTVVLVQGEAQADDTGAPFTMPKLPSVFALGAPDAPIDDFRLYDRLLDAAAVRALPGFAAAP